MSPYEPRARHAFLNHAFSRKNIGFVSDRKTNDDENRDKPKKKSGDTLSSRNLRIEAGWLARLVLGDDGMMERYLPYLPDTFFLKET